MPSRQSINEHLRLEFNDWARAGKGESMERGHRPVGEQAIDRMQIPPDARVLDVGCGSGWAGGMTAALGVTGFLALIVVAAVGLRALVGTARRRRT